MIELLTVPLTDHEILEVPGRSHIRFYDAYHSSDPFMMNMNVKVVADVVRDCENIKEDMV